VKRVQLRVTGARNLPLANDSDVYVVVVPQRSSKTTGATVRSALGVAKFSDVVDVTVAHDELVRIELFTHNRFARDSRIATVSLLGAALRTCDDWWSMSVEHMVVAVVVAVVCARVSPAHPPLGPSPSLSRSVRSPNSNSASLCAPTLCCRPATAATCRPPVRSLP
jgi:hypothetical protein